MSNDPNDKILDAFLNELLGEEKPGKRAAEIARAVESNRHQRKSKRSIPPDLPNRKSREKRNDFRNLRRWKTFSVVVTIVLVGMSIAALVLILDPAIQRRLRGANGDDINDLVVEDKKSDEQDNNELAEKSGPDRIDIEILNHLSLEKGQDPPSLVDRANQLKTKPFEFAPIDRKGFVAATRSELTERIDHAIQNSSSGSISVVTAPVDNLKWAKRVFDGVFGISPDTEQLETLVAKVDESDKASTLSWMFQQEQYKSAFIEKWAKSLATELGGRPSTFAQNPFGKSLIAYLTEAIREERNWDEIGFELLSATGKIESNSDRANPVAMVASLLFENGVNREQYAEAFISHASNRTVSCSRCHDKYSSQVSQADYWSLQSCFLQLDVKKADENTFTISNKDANPNPGQTRDDVALYFEDENGKMRAAYPPYPKLKEKRYSGKISVFDRRSNFAYSVVETGEWHSNIVDKIWQELLGESLLGRFRSIDGLQDQNLADLHAALTEQLIADPSIARIVAAIAISDAFSAPDAKDNFSNDQHRFASFKRKQVPTSMETLHVLARVYRTEDKNDEPGVLARKIIGTPEYKSIPPAQRAFLESERPRGKWAAPNEVAALLDKIEASELTTAQKLNHLFMLAQGRQPSSHEMAAMRSVVVSSTDQSSALSDIWWSLVNSQY